MKRLLLIGPPGGGKGTQAAIIKQHWHVPHISTGDLLRAAVRDQTPLGKKAEAVMAAGDLVSDDIMLGLIKQRLSETDAVNGFILDGYPRNLPQAQALQDVLNDLNMPLNGALLIEVEPENIVQRLAKRAQDEGRSDDTAEVVRKRLDIYAEQTTPVADFYAKQEMLVRIQGEGDIEAITERILQAANAAGW